MDVRVPEVRVDDPIVFKFFVKLVELFLLFAGYF